jgi:filamentous hemagglutinin family protein
MNRICCLICSRVTNTWIAVFKNAGWRRQSGRRALLGRKAIVGRPGSVRFRPASAQSGNTTTIRQSSQNLSINWQSFNIGSQETVDFLQPDASAIAVNRIFSAPTAHRSSGHLEANGQVWLINPNGIVFGARRRGERRRARGLRPCDVNQATLGGSTPSFEGSRQRAASSIRARLPPPVAARWRSSAAMSPIRERHHRAARHGGAGRGQCGHAHLQRQQASCKMQVDQSTC